jgi:uroporphyrinogen-III synthase
MQNMQPLQGVGVLVTRPEQQATPLCRLLESAGALALRLPVIEIRPAADPSGTRLEIGAIEAFDLVIFTSANAVRFGSALLDDTRDDRRGHRCDVMLAAIGPATARALGEAGYRVAVAPSAGFDSESLLLHPVLADPAGRRILLIKGMNGRNLLETRLTERGAVVVVADVYKRERVSHSAATLDALAAEFAAGKIHIVTATSVDIAAGLLDIATPVLRRHFDRVRWLVPGDRVAAALRERTVSGPILKASTAEDQDLVAAVVRWRSSASGA